MKTLSLGQENFSISVISILRKAANFFDPQITIRTLIAAILGVVYFMQPQKTFVAHSVGSLALLAVGSTLARLLDLVLLWEARGKLRRQWQAPSDCRIRDHHDKFIIVLPGYFTESQSNNIKDPCFRRISRLTQKWGAWPTRGVKHLEYNVKVGAAIGDVLCARKVSKVFAEKLGAVPRIMTDDQLMRDIIEGRGADYEGAVFFLVGIYSNYVTNLLAATLTFQHQGHVAELRAAVANDPHTILAFVPTDLHERALQGRSEAYLRAYDGGCNAAPWRMCIKPRSIQDQNRKLDEFVPTEFFLAKVPWTISISGCNTLTVTAVILGGLTERGTSAAGCYFAEHWQEMWSKKCGPNNQALRDQYFVGAVRKDFNYLHQCFGLGAHDTDQEHFAALRKRESGLHVFLTAASCRPHGKRFISRHAFLSSRKHAYLKKQSLHPLKLKTLPKARSVNGTHGNGHLTNGHVFSHVSKYRN
jgi:hypothetical protein